MSEIQSITKRIRHQEWANQIQERIQSGQSVSDWCRQHGIGIDAYKYRLRVVRLEAIEASPESFAELREPTVPAPSRAVSPCRPASPFPAGVSIEINGAVIRIDSDTPESLISAAVRAVRNA